MDRPKQILLALSEAAAALQTGKTPDEVYRILGQRMGRVGYQTAVLKITDDGDHLELAYHSFESAAVRAVERLVGVSPADFRPAIREIEYLDRVILGEQTLFLGESRDPLRHAFPDLTPRIASKVGALLHFDKGIYAPLKAYGSVQGMLIVSGADLTQEDVTAVTAFANQAAIAAANARLYQETNRSEARFKAIFESTTDCILVWDRDYNYLYANQAAIDHVGTTRERVIGKNILEGLGHIPNFMQLWMDRVDQIFESGEMVRVEDAVLVGDKLVHSESVLSPIRDEDGNMFAVGVVYRDITERKRAERELRESEDRYRSFVENFKGIAFRGDTSFVPHFIHGAVEEITGYTAQELLAGHPRWNELVHAEDMRRHLEQVHTGSKFTPDREYRIVRKDGEARWVRELVTVVRDEAGEFKWVDGVFLDITERKGAEEALRQGLDHLRRTLEQSIYALAATIEMRDPYTAGHQRKVANLAFTMAKEMGLTHDQARGVYMAGLVHDIGKIKVPAEILSKPTSLSEVEWQIIKTHPQTGFEILQGIQFPWPVAEIVLRHHERVDGSGYPEGLAGNRVPLEAKILAVADVVEAMSSHRPYRPAHSMEETMEDIQTKRGTLYDPNAVDACVKVVAEKGSDLGLGGQE